MLKTRYHHSHVIYTGRVGKTLPPTELW